MPNEEPSEREKMLRQIESQRLRLINPDLVAECPFCNIGDENKRGILVKRDEHDYVIGGHNPPYEPNYYCGAGRNSCVLLQLYRTFRSK